MSELLTAREAEAALTRLYAGIDDVERLERFVAEGEAADVCAYIFSAGLRVTWESPTYLTDPLRRALAAPDDQTAADCFDGAHAQLRCPCIRLGGGRCMHVRAALVLYLRGLAQGERPAAPWERVVDRLAAASEGAAREPEHDGRVRYHLIGGEAPVRRELIRRSLRTGAELKPIAMPRRWDNATAKVRLSRADRRIHDLLQVIERIGRRLGWGDKPPPVDALVRELFAALAGCDVRCRDRPVLVDPAPLALSLRVIDSMGEGLLVPDPRPLHRMRFPGGVVVVALAGDVDGDVDRVAAVAPDTPHELLELLDGELVVPRGDLPRLIERVARQGLDVRIDEALAPDARLDGELSPRLLLGEEGDALRLRYATAYLSDDGAVMGEVAVDDPRAALPALGPDGEPAMVARDREAEDALSATVEALVGASLPAELVGDDALDFLADRLPALRQRVEVFGAESLSALRLAPGAVAPAVRVASGIDWFDVRVDFTVDGARVSRAAVLRAMRDGARYVRVDDGRLARLPAAWVARHRRALEELEAIRVDGKLGAHAAPLAAGLLEEATPAGAEEGAGELGDWRARAASLMAGFEGVPERDAPPLDVELRDYQHRGFRWMVFLRESGLAGCLADDMGLGKTLQALALLADSHADAGADGGADGGAPSLVVAPTSVVHNWAAEAAKFAPQLSVSVWHGSDRGPLEDARAAQVVVTSYGLLRHQAEALAASPWRHVVLDEAQAIKNPTSQTARAARSLEAAHRLALTGTPLENDLFELWSLFQFLMPGFFGSRAGFGRRYARPIHADGDEAALAALRQRIRPFVLRRLKSEVASELPPLQTMVLRCELGAEQRAVYEEVRQAYRDEVMAAVDEVGIGQASIKILEALTRLRQACCDTRLLPDEVGGRAGSAKVDLLLETLEQAVAEGHRSLVFSQWPSLLRLVEPELASRGIEHLYLDGQTRDRQQLVEQWQADDGPPVFLISLKAGGTGLTLTGADHVFHLDPWWNPQVERQATDRAHRIGQTRPVIAYKLVARDTVEEKVLELQERKRSLFEATLEADRLQVDRLTREDLEQVLGPSVGPLVARSPGRERVRVEFGEEEEAPSSSLSSQEEQWPEAIAGLLAAQGKLTNARVREATGWTAERARQWLRVQVDAGRLEQRGQKRGTHYVERT